MTTELAYEILKGIIGITETDVEAQGNEEGGLLTVECFKVALNALEKQIPKKPTKEHGYFRCQDCGHPFTNDEFDRKATHCECGQAVLWEAEP